MKNFFTALFTASVFLTACSPQLKIAVTPNADGASVACDFSVSIHDNATAVIASLTGSTEVQIDDAAINASLKKAGFTKVSTTPSSSTKTPVSLGVRAEAPSITAAFSAIPHVAAYTAPKGNNPAALTITISNKTIPEILALVPAETVENLDFLLAPLFNGESMNEKEYRETIAVVYGGDAASLLEKSVFKISFVLPKGGAITEYPPSAKIDKKNGEKTSEIGVSIPLTALLCAREKLVFRVTW